jgi:carbohydrate-selective porin OprB
MVAMRPAVAPPGRRSGVAAKPNAATTPQLAGEHAHRRLGRRAQAAARRGCQADLLYTADYLRNTTGGLQRGGAYMGHVDLILQFDGEKLFGWKGGSGYLQ